MSFSPSNNQGDLCGTVSYHQLQQGVPVVPQHKEPVAEGALLAEALQKRRKQCCQESLSAPLLQQQGEQLNFLFCLKEKQKDRNTLETKLNAFQGKCPSCVVCRTWGLVLAQAKSRNDVLVDLVLVFQRVKGRHAGCADWRSLFHC